MASIRDYCYHCMEPLPYPDSRCPHCGRENHLRRTTQESLPGCVLANRYLVGRAMEQTPSGLVYLALDARTNEKVKIHECFPRQWVARSSNGLEVEPRSMQGARAFEAGLERQAHRIRALRELRESPSLPAPRQAFEAYHTIYTVLDAQPLVSLEDMRLSQDDDAFSETMHMMKPLMQALDQAHQLRLYHGAIHAESVQVDPKTASAVLPDFAYAGNPIWGLPQRTQHDPYVAPETFLEEYQPSAAADQYALAAILYTYLTGHPPASALARLRGTENLISPTRYGIPLPRPAEEAFHRALAINPRERFPSFAALIDAMEAPEKGTALSAKRIPPITTTQSSDTHQDEKSSEETSQEPLKEAESRDTQDIPEVPMLKEQSVDQAPEQPAEPIPVAAQDAGSDPSQAEHPPEAIEPLLLDLLDVTDNLERAVQVADEKSTLRDGVLLTLKQMQSVLEKYGVEPYEAIGQPFDPEVHDAIMMGTKEEGAPGTVCQVLQKGYMRKGKIFRYAKVKVVPEEANESE